MKNIAYLLVLLLSNICVSQINYEKGYFIDNSGTTTECYIKNVGWQSNPTFFNYKITDDGASEEKSIETTKEFSVGEGYKFKRFEVAIDRSPEVLSKMSRDKQPAFKKEVLFLKLLVEGEVNLYEYQGVDFIRFFISTGTHDVAEQLVYKKYLTENNQVGTNNQFRQQLSNTLKSEKLTLKDFEKVAYKSQDLINMFMKNSGEAGDHKNLVEKQNKGLLNLKARLGANNVSADINSETNSTFDFDPAIIIAAGLEVEYFMAFNKKKWAIFVDANYQSYKSEGEKITLVKKIDYSFVEVALGIRHYMFLNDKLKIFVNGGFATALNTSTYLQFSDNLVFEVVKNAGSTFAGVGLSFNRFSLEARYNTAKRLLEKSGYWNSEYNSFGVIATYKLL